MGEMRHPCMVQTGGWKRPVRPASHAVRPLAHVVLGALISAASVVPGFAGDGNGLENDRSDVETTYAQPASPPLPSAADSPVWSGPRITLLWFDPRETLPGGFETVRQEVTRIFREIGVDVRWTVGGLGTTFGASGVPEVPVILLPDDPAPVRRGQRIMGLVMRSQEPSRAVWVFLKSVRWTLGHDMRKGGPRTEAEAQELALAVARVAAHEVVHAIAPDEPHSQGGLMNHSLSRGFLLGRRLPVDPQCAAAFLTRLAALLPPAPEPAAAGLRTVPVAGF
jgi:hypothetical protein